MMPSISRATLAAGLLLLLFLKMGVMANADAQPESPSVSAEPKKLYSQRRVEGWNVYVDDVLWQNDRAGTEKALRLLQKQLAEIVHVVAPSALTNLQKVSLWFSPEYPGTIPRAEYHPGEEWLREHGRNPAMVKSVEFTNIRQFEQEMNRMPNFTLHELAHAYHDRVLPGGFENPDIKQAYERARASKIYDKVERWFGNGRPDSVERAYAMTSPPEYFAECSEAFFSRNDFFPFTREELQKHDPEMFQLLQRLWNLPDK